MKYEFAKSVINPPVRRGVIPKANNTVGYWPVLVILVAALAAGGCSSSTTTSGVTSGPGGGTHPVDFLSTHPGFAVSDVGECKTCHGEDLTGGIANVSCFQNAANCHHGTVSSWVSPAVHGSEAKKAPGSSGFVSCQICHASDFSGGGSGVSCFLCHAPPPHPSQWRTGDTFSHTNTDQGNAPVCAQCHLAGANSPIAPPPSPVPGAQPGCFNSTLCHALASGHPSGWSNPESHGTAAKSAPSGSTGFAYCQACHGTGTDFAGGSSGISCYTCHGASAPHPASWRPGDTYVHTAADPGNASVCAFCHANGANSPIAPPSPPPPGGTPPGCFNSTLCHGAAAAPHALGSTWIIPGASFHGLTAKADLAACQTCHGTPGTILFDGGIAPTACSTCHPGADAHPTTWSEAPQTGFPPYTSSHRNAGSIATVCAICHVVDGPGTGPNPAAPSCFSASFTNSAGVTASCHASGPGQVPHAVPFLAHTDVTGDTFNEPFPVGCASCHAVTGTSPVASAPLCTTCHTGGSPLTSGNCTSCHAEPPAGAAYPDIAGSHVKHDALAGVTAICATCHNGIDSGTQGHYDRANARPGKDALRVPPGDAVFLAKFNAKSGTASFDSGALACSNVSCHGGIPTPGWQTGSIAVNTDAGCRQCHTPGTAAGTPESNSPFSGLHGFHLGGAVNALCTECHDMANGTSGASNHFAFLDTPALEGPPSQTVEPIGNPAFYNATDQTCGTFTCHGRLHVDFSWTGGGAANHSVPFLSTTHTALTQAGFSGNCAACHAESGTSPLSSAPVCQECHRNAGVSPLDTKDCTSCHAEPPAGTAYPNAAGRHAKHNGLAGVTGICGTCHDTLESGTLEHYDRANGRPGMDALRVPPGDTKFLSTFNAKTGTASFNTASFTCSKVSCHGGVTTPRWDTGTIAVTTDAGCLQCHILGGGPGTPENNSPFTGRHAKHLTGLGSKGNAVCTECHDMANGTQGASDHFAFLDTPQMEGPAGQTIEPLGAAANYNASNQTCTLTCHTQVHAAFPWTGLVTPNHPVPFLNGTHTTVTQAGFAGNCAACHALAGTSPVAAAPRCDSCHTNLAGASPLTNKDCTSCHAEPPSGTSYPNAAGRHGVHLGLNSAGSPVSCSTCHNGIGSGTQGHYDRAKSKTPPGDVAFLSTYNARSGTSSFSSTALTCSQVSCHGGQTTPNFRTGTIDVNTNTGCLQCHAYGTGQFNSFRSGEHDKHVNEERIGCRECHNMDLGTSGARNHFAFLATQVMEGPASDTFQNSTGNVAYNTTAKTCTGSCHGESHEEERWVDDD